MKDNQYNQSSKDKFCNSSVNFSDSAHEPTREEKEKVQDNITRLINETIKDIHER